MVIVGFHTDFLGVIGTSFKDADLEDILIQSRVLANGFVEWTITVSMTTVPFEGAQCTKLLTVCWLWIWKKNAASTEDIYSVLPLDWNNESYYHKFVDSEKMKKYVIAFYD